MENQILHVVSEKLVNANITLQYKDASVFNLIRSTDDLSAMAARIGDTILNEVAYIKNKQKPVYDSYVNLVTQQIKESQTLSELSDYNVITFKCSDTLNAFARKNKLPSSVVTISPEGNADLTFELPHDEDIRLAFKYQEDAELSILVDRLLEKFSISDLKNIFTEYVSNPDPNSLAYSPNRQTILKKDPDVILLAYIAIHNLIVNKPSAHAGMEPRIYSTTMDFYKTNLGNQLVTIVNENRGRVERHQLVIQGDVKDKEIIVQDEVYNEFINAGGSVEVLFGMLVTNEVTGPERLLESVQAKADYYLKAWQDKVNVTRLANVQNELGRFKVAYSIAIGRLIDNEMSEDIVAKLPAVRNEIVKSADEIISVLNQETLTNIGKTAQILISKLIFPDSKFEEFTTNMLKAAETVPNISSNDAASYASIKMLIGYLLEQVTTTQF